MIEKILLHTCCADCFLNALENLIDQKIIYGKSEVISLFFNPNIHPRSEYLERLNALKKIIAEDSNLIDTFDRKKIHLVIPDYKPKEYIEAFINKKGSRCLACWELRLKYTYEYAQKNSIDTVTTTLLTSHYQNRDDICKIADNFSKEYCIDFVKLDSSSNCKHNGFYKQNYCGCCFSLTEKMLGK